MMTSNRRIPLIAGAAALLLVVIWYFLLWTPQTKGLHSAHKAQAAAEAKVADLQSQQTSLQGLVKRIPADNASFARLEAALPDNPQLDQALNLFQQAAISTGTTVTSLSPTTPPGAVGAQRPTGAQSGEPAVTLSMAVKGNLDQIGSFLTALNQLPRTVVVDRISYSNAGGSSTASITARIFYAGQPTP